MGWVVTTSAAGSSRDGDLRRRSHQQPARKATYDH